MIDDSIHPVTPRQRAIYDELESLVETFGKFDQSTGPDGAHYVAASPFAGEGLVCSNCAFYEGPRGCDVVDGDIDPGAICKLWVIPADLIPGAETSVDAPAMRSLVDNVAEYRRTESGIVTPKVERRRASELEVRTDGDTVTVEGYATVYDHPYDVGGLFTETIARGAAAKSAQEADVRFLVNHDGLPLARTKSGTMTLTSDDVGLRVRAELSAESTLAADVLDAMRRGDLDEMSFAFGVVNQTWDPGNNERTIREVKLYDVSVVTYPANPATAIQIAEPEPQPRSAMSLTLARSVLDARA